MKVFLDDERNHPEEGWTHVRSTDALYAVLNAHWAEITCISFDNDLQTVEEGWEALRNLVEQKLDHPLFLPALERIVIHSANNEAVKNMLGRLDSAKRAGVLDVIVEHRPATQFAYPLAADDPRNVVVLDRNHFDRGR